MRRLSVSHVTTYRYARPVRFTDHFLMARPREGHDLQLIGLNIETQPAAEISWRFDPLDNSVAILRFGAVSADELRVACTLRVDQSRRPAFDFLPTRDANVVYPDHTLPDLLPLMRRQHQGAELELADWVTEVRRESGAHDVIGLLVAMTKHMHSRFRYSRRDEPGVQTPGQTLSLRSGSCRDYALLFMEAARSVNLAARFVSGYLYDPALDRGGAGLASAGATHAWAQVFLPNLGWTEFDPTNGAVGGDHLIRVALARDPAQAVPLQGSFIGAAGDFRAMDVTVEVRDLGANGP